MKIEAGKKYRTRDGRVALVGAVNPEADNHQTVIGWVGGNCTYWSSNGMWKDSAHPLDLVEKYREPREWWLSMSLDGHFAGAYATKEQAICTNMRMAEPIHVREIIGDHK